MLKLESIESTSLQIKQSILKIVENEIMEKEVLQRMRERNKRSDCHTPCICETENNKVR